jgi:hypothetical protein
MGLFGAIGGAIKSVGGGVGKTLGKLPGLGGMPGAGGGAPAAPAVQTKPMLQPGTPAAPLSKKASAAGSRSFSAKRRF